MNILLIGATGMIGSRILNEAVERGHTITALSRNIENVPALANVNIVKGDVYDVEFISEHAAQADVIVSALSPRNTDDGVAEAEAFTQALIAIQQKSKEGANKSLM